jgi:hypothetical protein
MLQQKQHKPPGTLPVPDNGTVFGQQFHPKFVEREDDAPSES